MKGIRAPVPAGCPLSCRSPRHSRALAYPTAIVQGHAQTVWLVRQDAIMRPYSARRL